MCEQNIFKNCNILTYFSNLLELLINFSELAFHLLFNEIYFKFDSILSFLQKNTFIYPFSRIVIEIYFPIKKK